MGYSVPKKQLDLKEFLSTPAKKRPMVRRFGSFKPQPQAPQAATPPVAKPDDATE
ncbi:hypothetical protein [Tropicibacter alexandrii]|uniref:hypothetical protein n=1 Tax=Tropicibacter alexandrii TaxID=2267683 RepID=UPI0013E8AA3C|nr:hypothetical protein [Tropicibacter alexandrii]